MQVWFRLLIVWFVAIALPAQGIASATMAHCGSSHGRMDAAVEASAHRHAHPMAGAAHHHDGAAVAVADHADHGHHAAATPAEAAQGKVADLAKYKCSSCASCCAGAALPGAMPSVPPSTDAPADFIDAVVTIDAFASDGPDRPPRLPLV